MNNLISKHLVIANVERIYWERITVYLDVRLNFTEKPDILTDLSFYAVNGLNAAKAIFAQEKIEENLYRLSLNITNPGDVRCLPVGTYKIYLCQNENILAYCVAGLDIVKRIEEVSRNFLYGGRNSVYTVSFMIEEGEDDLPLVMHALSAKRVSMEFASDKKLSIQIPNLEEYKRKNSKPFLRKIYAYYRKKYQGQKKSKKAILFMSEQSNTLGSNLTAVYNRIKERGLDKNYILLKSARMASSQRQSQKSWIELIKKMAMSDMIFLDDHAPVLDWLKIDKETEIIQLWHAGAGFKSSGYSRWGHIGCPAPSSAHRQYKYGIAGSKNIAHFFSEVWGINTENVFPTGMPRIDEYLNEEYQAKKTQILYTEFPACNKKKVILFAPTYRGKNRKEAHYPYEIIDFEKLYRLCGEEYVVLFKMHPWVATPVPIASEYRDRFFDVSGYPNINDLFYITDLLITDYSSNIFEYSLMKRPMIFFAFDEIQYSFSRGFHRDYELSAPGKVCHTFDELLTAIEKEDFEYKKVEEYVQHHFDYIDTHASDRVIDWIILGNIPKDILVKIQKRKDEQEKIKLLDFSVLDCNPNIEGEEQLDESENVISMIDEDEDI